MVLIYGDKARISQFEAQDSANLNRNENPLIEFTTTVRVVFTIVNLSEGSFSFLKCP